MNIFLDSNVLVAIVNKEYPLYTYAARMASLADKKRYSVYTSPLCLAIAFYFAQKKSKATARQKIALFTQHLKIAAMSASAVNKVAANSTIHDFEDGLQYYAAQDAGCKCMVTEDLEDFYFSEIEVLSCEQFFEKYMKN